MTTELSNFDTTPRTPEQVEFVPNLPWEYVAAMYRQCVADGGLTMSYGARAKEVIDCARTALPSDEYRDTQLASIGVLLVLWEGTIMLYEDILAEKDAIIEARGKVVDFAQRKITELLAAATDSPPTNAEPPHA